MIHMILEHILQFMTSHYVFSLWGHLVENIVCRCGAAGLPECFGCSWKSRRGWIDCPSSRHRLQCFIYIRCSSPSRGYWERVTCHNRTSFIMDHWIIGWSQNPFTRFVCFHVQEFLVPLRILDGGHELHWSCCQYFCSRMKRWNQAKRREKGCENSEKSSHLIDIDCCCTMLHYINPQQPRCSFDGWAHPLPRIDSASPTHIVPTIAHGQAC